MDERLGGRCQRGLRRCLPPHISIPTEEELQTGKFYKDIHEYRKAPGLSDAA